MIPAALGIDLGARYTRCLVVALGEEGPRFYSSGEVRSEGWRKGVPHDHGVVAECVRQALELARREVALPLGRAVLGYGSTGTPDTSQVAEVARLLDLQNPEFLFEPEAASRVVLSPEELESGAILLDLGAQSSSVAVWCDGEVGYATGLPVGGDHFTQDIAASLQVPIEDAAELKERHGSVFGPEEGEQMISIPGAGRKPIREVSRALLSQVLEARAGEMIAYLDHTLRQQGVDPDFSADLFVVGGGAHLKGIHSQLMETLRRPVKTGLPGGIDGLPDTLRDPAWTVAAGLAVEAAWRCF